MTQEDAVAAPSTAVVDAGPTVAVSAMPPLERRCRAGHCFYNVPAIVPIASVDAATLEAWLADPMLVVSKQEAAEAGQ